MFFTLCTKVGLGSAPREEGHQEREKPQGGPGEAQVGHEKEFAHGEGGQEMVGTV